MRNFGGLLILKRILQLPGSIEKRNGRMSVIMSVYRQIDRSQVQFDFIATDYGFSNYYDEIKRLGGKIFLLPEDRLSIRDIQEYFKKVIIKNNYDFVHYHAISKWGVCLSLAKKQGIRVIVQSHSTRLSDNLIKSIRNRMFSLNIFWCADKRVAISPEAGKKLFLWKNFEYIPNMINYSNFLFNKNYRKKIRNKLNVSNDDLLIGMVGRISKQKNQIYALKILKEFIKNNNKVKLAFLGDADNKEHSYLLKVKDYIKKNGLEKNVLLLGLVDDVEQYYSAFDIFWMVSFFEGMPTSAIEAQANGLPVILSNNITRKVDIVNNVWFLPINKRNITSWVDKTAMYEDKRVNNALSCFESSDFGTKKVITKWSDLYELGRSE